MLECKDTHVLATMALLCHACGVDLSTKKSYERHPLSGKAASYVRSDMTAILKEQATSLGVNLDDSALLSDGFICRGCLRSYRTHKEQFEKLKQKANQVISAFHTVSTSNSTVAIQRKRHPNPDQQQPSAKRCLFATTINPEHSVPPTVAVS